jgi:hypothetical protein
MPATGPARTLEFKNISEVAAEARRLRRGCERTGQWNLAQACRHLNEWMTYPMDGFPKPPMVVGWVLTALRLTLGPGMLRSIIRDGSMKAGFGTDPRTAFPADVDESAAVDALVATCARLDAWTGPIHPSPLFGAMDKPTLIKLQLAHAALHLGYLVPNES